MEQKRAQETFAVLVQTGLWRYDPNLATIDYGQYLDLINKITPQNYEVAYDLGPINYIEKGYVDMDKTNTRAELIRRERTWKYGPMQAFELQVITVPSLILMQGQPQEKSSNLTTTWWINPHGDVEAYRQILNGNVLEDDNYVR